MSDRVEGPSTIDGARVVVWAWSGCTPFGKLGDDDVYGIAIATYDDTEFYRFVCDRNWETLQDALHSSPAEAIDQLPDQYCNVCQEWHWR